MSSTASKIMDNPLTRGVADVATMGSAELLNQAYLQPKANHEKNQQDVYQQGVLNSTNLDQLLNNIRTSQAMGSRGQLLGENAANTTQRTDTLNKQQSARDAQLKSLASLLAEQNQTQVGQAMPNVLEDLNSRGLLRSSAVGNQLANAQSQLQERTNQQLAQQALANQSAYTSGLGGITEADIAGKGSATQRQFSLQDYANQIQAGKILGKDLQPQAPSGKGGNVLGGALGGAGVGAQVGGPWGAAAGGAAGGLLGSKSS
jgi:hypothetical protein